MNEMIAAHDEADRELAITAGILAKMVSTARELLADGDRTDVVAELTALFVRTGECATSKQIFTATVLALAVVTLAEG
jgi:hypothetical protein